MVKPDSLRHIPSVDRILSAPEVVVAVDGLPLPAVRNAVRAVLDQLRQRLAAGDEIETRLTPAELAPLVAHAARQALEPKTKRVINATGIIIHTNLGRAPLAAAAVDAAAQIAGGYSNLEYDLVSGKRGGRTAAVESLLVDLTGAEAALAVNNNAAALMLVLGALAKAKDVIVSRGELIEIGGSFRLPEIMAGAGCVMREVGTTNKTHLKDYERAIGKKTALLMKVHTSNYEVVGFTSTVTVAELAVLARANRKPLVEDLGSGNLIDSPGLSEPTVRQSVKAGADLITFSGDKLLGGPQCGLIVGAADLISKLRANPIYRAVRLDKMSLAALEATLRLYLYDDPLKTVPVLVQLSQEPGSLAARAAKLMKLIGKAPETGVDMVQTVAKVGGGAMPGRELESQGVRLAPSAMGVDELGARLRQGDPPIIGRIIEGAFILDMLTVADGEIAALAAGIKRAIT